MDTLHAKLKAATHQVHCQLHHQHHFSRLLQRDLTLAEYVQCLQMLFDFYQPKEYALSGLSNPFDIPVFTQSVPAVHLLKQDFLALDIPYSEPSTSVATFSTPEQYLGYLYLKQGSTLGGKHISRALQRSLGLEPNHSLFFFAAYGGQPDAVWEQFLTYLQGLEPQVNHQQVCDAAVAYFQQFYQQLLAIPELAIETQMEYAHG